MRCTPPRLAAAMALVTGLALLPSQLFGVQGVESALVLGIVLPPWVGAAAAWRWLRSTAAGSTPPMAARLLDQLRFALAVWAVPVGLLALNQLRLRNCTPGTGLALLVLGPGFGCALAALLGSVVAELVRPRRRLAIALAAAAASGGLLLGVGRLFASPAVFVFDHLVGYFPGSFYDAGVTVPIEYLTFRGFTLLIMLTLAAWLSVCRRGGTLGGNPWSWGWAAGLVLVLVVAERQGAALGHRSDAAWMAAELGGVGHGRRCTVHVPRELAVSDRRLLQQDCDFRVAQAERTLGTRQSRRLHAFFFRDAAEKRRLMGASHTNIAKPWRHEVYLLVEPWPHPILAHEVAHVVGGNLAPGPLHIAGRWSGFLPEPTLIEGLAVASAWTVSDDLTPHAWAKALLDADRLPHLQDMLGLRFLLYPARSVYTAAGSWLRFILDTQGQAALGRIYRSADPQAALGKPIAQLDRQWRAFLRRQPLPAAARAVVASKFVRSSLFTATCPHRLALLSEQLTQDRQAGDWQRVTQTCAAILALDADDAVAVPAAVVAQAQGGDLPGAKRAVDTIRQRYGANSPLYLAAAQALADAFWQRGDQAVALASYRSLQPALQNDSLGRAVDIKVAALSAGGESADLVRSILVGEGGRSAPPRLAMHLLQRLRTVAVDGIGAYLIARQLLQEGRYAHALPLLAEAAARGLPSARLQRENQALQGAALVATGAVAAATELWTRELHEAPAGSGRALIAQDWLDRMAFL